MDICPSDGGNQRLKKVRSVSSVARGNSILGAEVAER